MQVMKEVFLPAFEELSSCLGITLYAIQNIRVNRNILDEKKYDHLFTVEEVNKLVMKGMPFRDAYREVGRRVMEGEFVPDRSVEHTHEGSIGNLCLNEIRLKKEEVVKSFHFKGYQSAVEKLLNTSLRG